MPLNSEGQRDGERGSFVQPGASTIYREQGSRLIAVKFDVEGRDLASAVAEAQRRTAGLIMPPFRVEWAGEFEEMEWAERRLMLIVQPALDLRAVQQVQATTALRRGRSPGRVINGCRCTLIRAR